MQTEPIGSVPRPITLLQALVAFNSGHSTPEQLDRVSDDALRDTIQRFEQTGSPVITDGEQTKPSFATYPLSGLTNLASDGVVIPFADGHTRQLPRLASGPFRYGIHAGAYTAKARTFTKLPLKQAVISASALSLLYPSEPLPGYPREAFIADLLNEAETDIRSALSAGAHTVQIDFTEARLSLKLDPSGGLLRSFINLKQPGHRPLYSGRASAHRRPRLPRRRPRLHPLRRRRLHRAPPRPLPTQRRPLLSPDG
jgi:5-methyltetrahydropteroyltriglutamate--homocysteine methyltransferase